MQCITCMMIVETGERREGDMWVPREGVGTTRRGEGEKRGLEGDHDAQERTNDVDY